MLLVDEERVKSKRELDKRIDLDVIVGLLTIS
jgi:hypothetical protein